MKFRIKTKSTFPKHNTCVVIYIPEWLCDDITAANYGWNPLYVEEYKSFNDAKDEIVKFAKYYGYDIDFIHEVFYSKDECERPPLGLTPKFIVQEKRVDEIKEAMSRYFNVNKPIPVEWFEEYNELANSLKK